MEATQIVLHPGAHVGAGADAGIAKIIEGLNEVLSQDYPVQIALETMAGRVLNVAVPLKNLQKL